MTRKTLSISAGGFLLETGVQCPVFSAIWIRNSTLYSVGGTTDETRHREIRILLNYRMLSTFEK